MEVSVETLGTLGRRMTIVVPPEKLGQAFDSRVNEIARKAKIGGEKRETY